MMTMQAVALNWTIGRGPAAKWAEQFVQARIAQSKASTLLSVIMDGDHEIRILRSHQRSSLGPSNAPRPVAIAIPNEYQTRMKAAALSVHASA